MSGIKKKDNRVGLKPGTFTYPSPIKDNVVLVGDGAVLQGRNTIQSWQKSDRNAVEFGKNFKCNNLKIVFKGSDSKLIIGNDVRLTGHILIVGNRRTVSIGNRSTFQGVYLLSRGADLTIGDDCMFSREIEVRTTDVHKIYDKTTGDHLNPAKLISIGNQIWVAARVIISKGVLIPDGCIIGAASFVNKIFDEENTVIAGQPAAVVKRNVVWKR
jgi:acetyltransferase-like isoleucine patch superfamily enzyme